MSKNEQDEETKKIRERLKEAAEKNPKMMTQIAAAMIGPPLMAELMTKGGYVVFDGPAEFETREGGEPQFSRPKEEIRAMSDDELLAFIEDAERRGAVAYNDGQLAEEERGGRIRGAAPGNYPCFLGGGCPDVHYGPQRHHAPAGCLHRGPAAWWLDELARLRCTICEAV